MAKTFVELQAQIEQLQLEAAKARRAELSDLIAKMRNDIETYGITAQDLFGRAAARAGRGKAAVAAPKFGDGQGRVWGGRGPRPQWLRDALAAGRSLDEFALNRGAVPGTAKTPRTMAKKKTKGAAPVAKRGVKRAANARAARPNGTNGKAAVAAA